MRSTADSPSARPYRLLGSLCCPTPALQGVPGVGGHLGRLASPQSPQGYFQMQRTQRTRGLQRTPDREKPSVTANLCAGAGGGGGERPPEGLSLKRGGGPGAWTSPDGTPEARALPAGPAQAERSSPYLGRCPSSPASFSSWASGRRRNGSKWRQRACSP